MTTNLKIIPIKNNPNLIMDIIKVAEKDGRRPIHMTHVVFKDGKIVGAFSIRAPVLFWWMHSTEATKRDSYKVFNSVETLMDIQGTPNYVIPCHPMSSYYNILNNRVGKGLKLYKGDSNDDWTIFLKD